MGTFFLATAFVVAREAWHGGVRHDFTWPTAFDAAHFLAWVAVLLLATDVVVELVLRRRRT